MIQKLKSEHGYEDIEMRMMERIPSLIAEDII